MIILDLCGGSGSWSLPYKNAGYEVIVVDPRAGSGKVEEFQTQQPIHGILAAPPCTHFSSSGALHWGPKDLDGRTRQAVRTTRACLHLISKLKPKWWALENPVGRIQKLVPELGKPVFKFDPCDFGHPYTKRTLLWGRFTPPTKSPVPAYLGSYLHTLSPGPERGNIRSLTPEGFANAFFKANP